MLKAKIKAERENHKRQKTKQEIRLKIMFYVLYNKPVE